MAACCFAEPDSESKSEAEVVSSWRTDVPHGAFPSQIGAIAFGGGGFKSVGAFWPVLYYISQSRDVRQILNGSHFGAASGGGWFFTHLMFNREAWRSLTTNRTEEQFMEIYRAYLEDIVVALQEHEKDFSLVKQKMVQKVLSNSALQSTLNGQGFPLFDDHMVRWIGGYLADDNGWRLLNDDLSRAQEKTPNGGLSATCDLANGILTRATINFTDNWIKDVHEFYEVEQDEDEEMSQIPMSINVRVTPAGTTCTMTLCQEKQAIDVHIKRRSTGGGIGDCTLACGHASNEVEVTKDDIERGLQKVMQSPHDVSGPTACYFACFNERFFSSYMGLGAGMVRNILVELEHKVLYEAFYEINPIDEFGQKLCDLRMVDGGPIDHTAIAMTVKGYQRERRSGALLAITLYSLESYENFHVLFTDFDNRGDHCGIAEPPYPRIFKGLPPQGCKRYGRYLQILDCTVETVDCPDFEIKGGQTIRLFYIFLMPKNLKLFPFKQESVEEYIAWCQDVMQDLKQWRL